MRIFTLSFVFSSILFSLLYSMQIKNRNLYDTSISPRFQIYWAVDRSPVTTYFHGIVRISFYRCNRDSHCNRLLFVGSINRHRNWWWTFVQIDRIPDTRVSNALSIVPKRSYHTLPTGWYKAKERCLCSFYLPLMSFSDFCNTSRPARGYTWVFTASINSTTDSIIGRSETIPTSLSRIDRHWSIRAILLPISLFAIAIWVLSAPGLSLKNAKTKNHIQSFADTILRLWLVS